MNIQKMKRRKKFEDTRSRGEEEIQKYKNEKWIWNPSLIWQSEWEQRESDSEIEITQPKSRKRME